MVYRRIVLNNKGTEKKKKKESKIIIIKKSSGEKFDRISGLSQLCIEMGFFGRTVFLSFHFSMPT